MSDIIMRCDHCCTEGQRSPTWVHGWDHLLLKAFTRAVMPEKPTTAHMMTLFDYCCGQVSRAMVGGASGPKAFTLLLRLLTKYF